MSRRRTSNCSVRLTVSRESPLSNNCSSTVRSCSSAYRFTACSACLRKKVSSSQTAIFKLSISLRILIPLLYARVGAAAIRFFCISRPENYISHFSSFYENFVVQYCEYRIKRKHLILALSSFGQHKTPYENEAPVKPGTPRFCLQTPVCTNRNSPTGSLGFCTYGSAFPPPSIPLFPTFRLCFQTY